MKKFCTNVFFSGQQWTGLSIRKRKKIQFLTCFIKMFISVLNFSTVSAKRPTIYDLLFPIALYSPKLHSPKTLTYHQLAANIFLLRNCTIKIRVCQTQSNWFVFKEAPAYKRRYMNTVKGPRQQICTVILWELFLLYLSLLKLVIEYKSGTATFWVRYFFQASSF